MNKLKLIPATMMALLGSTAFADCKIEDAKSGWTGSIKFSCDTDTNLQKLAIVEHISNIITNS